MASDKNSQMIFGYGLNINADQNKQSEAWAHNDHWHIP